MSKNRSKHKFYTKTQLAKRWSLSLIEKYYPQCDDTRRNPHCRRAAPMQLFNKKKVDRIESTDEFKADMERVLKAKEAAKASANKVTQMTCLEYADCLNITIPNYSFERISAVTQTNKYYLGLEAAQLATALTRRVYRRGKIKNQKDYDAVYDFLLNKVVEAIKQKFVWANSFPLEYLVK